MQKKGSWVLAIAASLALGYYWGSGRSSLPVMAEEGKGGSPRYQISAFGYGFERGKGDRERTHQGVYLVDTQTGEVWLKKKTSLRMINGKA
jgi:hypothetical protein